MEATTSIDDLLQRLRSRDFSGWKEAISHCPIVELAEGMERIGLDEQVVLFRLLPTEVAAKVFEYLPLSAQEEFAAIPAQALRA